MKYFFTLLVLTFLFSASLKSQHYTFKYNPYSGMNKAQLNLALEQSLKTQKSGKIWTAIGSGMLVGGAILTTQGINELSNSDNLKFGTFGTGLLIMSFSGFPLGYGLISWLSGKEKANMIEIELLASGKGHLEFKPGKYGLGLALSF